VEERKTRDPVAPAERSRSAKRKAGTEQLTDGTPVFSLRSLLEDLATVVRDTIRRPNAANDMPTFTIDTPPTPAQKRVVAFLATISP
jgi:hypothetical protein